jgi:formylglycine-generating enzyme required for sulfatase activity
LRRSLIGRADLLEALRPEADHALIARLLGFEPEPEEEPKVAPKFERISDEGTDQPETNVPVPQIQQEAMPFCRPERFSVRETRTQTQTMLAAGDGAWKNRPHKPPDFYPVAFLREILPALSRLIGGLFPIDEVDVDSAVRLIARGRMIDPVPRRTRRRFGGSVQVVLDRSDRLVPYWVDQLQILQVIRRLLPPEAIECAVMNEVLREPDIQDPPIGHYRPPAPGSVVLVLGDLGALDVSSWRVMQNYVALGRRIRAAGSRAVALIPGGAEICPDALRLHWEILPWGRAARQVAQARDDAADHLCRLLAYAVRIEPGLLRAMRCTLGKPEADASVEAVVWQRMESMSARAATLPKEAAQQYRQQFDQKLSETEQKLALELIRTWRWNARPEIWYEEIVNLPRAARDLVERQDFDDALEFFKSLPAELESDDGTTAEWLRRLEGRATPERLDNAVLQAIDSYRRDDETYRPAGHGDPNIYPPTGPQKLFSLRQIGESPWFGLTYSASRGGSWLCHLRASNEMVQVVGSFSWVVDSGTDEFGSWCEVECTDDYKIKPIRIRLRWIPAGRFIMGSQETEAERYSNESPLHEVNFRTGFWLMETTVTQRLWQAVMDKNPSQFRGEDLPVESVSWHDAQGFIAKINQLIPGLNLRLPSEAEWEYACRAGTDTPFSFGDTISPDQVNYEGNHPYAGGEKGLYRGKTVPVASLPANPWGLYEMHGNLWEWCEDDWHDNYEGAPADGTAWRGEFNAARVLRGGSWGSFARCVRSAYRLREDAGCADDVTGFRCARGQERAEPDLLREESSGGGAANFLLRAGLPAAENDQLPLGRPFVIRSDCEEIGFGVFRKPAWATGVGRDRFGLWSVITVEEIDQKLRWIPPGHFTMGSPAGSTATEAERFDDEGPQHEVIFKQGFWLFDTACTHELWTAVMKTKSSPQKRKTPGKTSKIALEKNNPGRFDHARYLPIGMVSWNDAREFINEINLKIAGLNLRLPSEAEWEYACRAGTDTPFSFGDTISPDQVNYDGNHPYAGGEKGLYRGKTVPVASLPANPWGLYEMHGNLWEWCEDGWHDDYQGAPADGTAWRDSMGAARVLRGGSWLNPARHVRSACRDWLAAGDANDCTGFRCARGQEAAEP